MDLVYSCLILFLFQFCIYFPQDIGLYGGLKKRSKQFVLICTGKEVSGRITSSNLRRSPMSNALPTDPSALASQRSNFKAINLPMFTNL